MIRSPRLLLSLLTAGLLTTSLPARAVTTLFDLSGDFAGAADTTLPATVQTGTGTGEGASYIAFSTSTALITNGFGNYVGPTLYGGVTQVNTASTAIPVFTSNYPAADRLGGAEDAIAYTSDGAGDNNGLVRSTYSATMGTTLATIAYEDLFAATLNYTGSADASFRGSALMVQLSNGNTYVSEAVGFGFTSLDATDLANLDWAVFTVSDTFGTDSDLRVTLPTDDGSSTMTALGLEALDVTMVGIYGYGLAGTGGTANNQAQVRELTVTAIPEPGTAALLVGAASLLAMRRRRA